MKIALIGSSQFVLDWAQTLIEEGCIVSSLLSLPHSLQRNNDVNIEEFSLLNNIPYFETNDIHSSHCISYLERLKLDFILSEWPFILLKNVINIPKYGVIGNHPTHLPRNRGRHL